MTERYIGCWAKEVSECHGGMSREHYVTKGLFDDEFLRVYNAPFLKKPVQDLPKKQLVRKCLCSKHNSELAKYDDEAIRLGKALEFACDLSRKRWYSTAKRFDVKQRIINKISRL